jgi:CRISPR-associated endoribonuclease Cas6
VRRFAAECLALGRYRLESTGVAAFGGRETAFTGRCTYVATHRDRYFLHCCAALLHFAFFSGVGAKASMGFGLVRWQDTYEPDHPRTASAPNHQ